MTFYEYLFSVLPAKLADDIWTAICEHQLEKCTIDEQIFCCELWIDYKMMKFR